MKPLRDYLNLCRTNPRLGAVALFAVALARLSLLAVPFRVLRRIAEANSAPAEVRPRLDASRRSRIALAVRMASRLIPGASCLTQALAAQALLRLRGDWGKLCIGVAKGELGELKAHAWLEADGKIVIGDSPDLSRYRQFAFSSAAR